MAGKNYKGDADCTRAPLNRDCVGGKPDPRRGRKDALIEDKSRKNFRLNDAARRGNPQELTKGGILRRHQKRS